MDFLNVLPAFVHSIIIIIISYFHICIMCKYCSMYIHQCMYSIQTYGSQNACTQFYYIKMKLQKITKIVIKKKFVDP